MKKTVRPIEKKKRICDGCPIFWTLFFYYANCKIERTDRDVVNAFYDEWYALSIETNANLIKAL